MIGCGLVLVLCGCAASLADIRKTPPQQSGTFVAPPAVLASCVQQRIEKIASPYQSRLAVSPDQREYYLTATRNDSMAKEPLIGYDLFIVGFNDGSLVELRQGASDGRAITKRVWPIVEVCGQQAAAPDSSAPFIQP